MNQTFEAILIYCLWSLILTTLILSYRSYLTLSGKKTANNFSPAGDDLSPFSLRLVRAHANCYENLPVTLGVLFSAILLGQEKITNPLAMIFVFARILQSITHLVNTSVLAVYLRFTFYLIQVSLLLYWVIKLLMAY